MKKLLLVMLFISIAISSMILCNSINEKKNINNRINKIDAEASSKKDEKTNELNKLKEENKDKINRYEEVEKWNQEILDYLK